MIFVDFERGIQNSRPSVSDSVFATYSRKTPLEEFCAFLFQEEQGIFSGMWDYEIGTLADFVHIESKRRKLLLSKIFGHHNGLIPVENLIAVDKLMVCVVTPFWWRGKAFFPLVYIDKAVGNGGASKYADIGMQYLAFKDPESKARFLEGL